MRQVLVRYRLKAERVEEHEALLHAVFEELRREAPAGLRYSVSKARDGGFVHVALFDEPNPLPAFASFRAFAERIAERCEEPPVTTELTRFDAYGP